MRPSEVRKHVLDDHRELRHRAIVLEGICKRIQNGDLSALGELKPRAERLLFKLTNHMRWEDQYLLPVLLEADAWGRERGDILTRDHEEQREVLGHITESVDDEKLAASVLAAKLANFVELLLADMLEEESLLLDPRVIRDDVIAVDMEAG